MSCFFPRPGGRSSFLLLDSVVVVRSFSSYPDFSCFVSLPPVHQIHVRWLIICLFLSIQLVRVSGLVEDRPDLAYCLVFSLFFDTEFSAIWGCFALRRDREKMGQAMEDDQFAMTWMGPRFFSVHVEEGGHVGTGL